MTKWFIMEHRSGAVGLASVPVKRRDGITQTFDTREAAAMAAKRRMSVACVSYTVEAIDCSPCPLFIWGSSAELRRILMAFDPLSRDNPGAA
jgi:hypothetical protein